MAECIYTNCFRWEPGIDEDSCDDCIDGRFTDEVNIYASTCDGCGELTSHEEMRMDKETQLGYCEICVGEMSEEEIKKLETCNEEE